MSPINDDHLFTAPDNIWAKTCALHAVYLSLSVHNHSKTKEQIFMNFYVGRTWEKKEMF